MTTQVSNGTRTRSGPFRYGDVAISFARAHRKNCRQRKAIDQQIEDLKAERQGLSERCPHFIAGIVEPLAKELVKKMPGRHYDILGPFGLCCQVSIHFYKDGVPEREKCDGDNCRSITFADVDQERGD